MSGCGSDGRVELPRIRRARDFRLYAEDGTRYLDLYQNGGRAILSHRPKGLAPRVKDVISQGLWGAYPSVYPYRLERVLRGLFPAYPVIRVYADASRAADVVAAVVGERPRDQALSVAGDADPAASPPRAEWWRPFLPQRSALSSPRPSVEAGTGGAPQADASAPPVAPELPAAPAVILPVLPFPAAFAPQVVCADSHVGAALPPSEMISPVLLAGLVHAAHLLEGVLRRGDGGRSSVRRQGNAVVDPVALFEKHRPRGWRRRGPYLELLCPAERFAEVFSLFLSEGILINPVYPGPSILPQWCSAGEFSNFVKAGRMAER
ncbi:MAG: hypothetical protein ACLFUM_02090 [Spirochaetaceae bacterium]